MTLQYKQSNYSLWSWSKWLSSFQMVYHIWVACSRNVKYKPLYRPIKNYIKYMCASRNYFWTKVDCLFVFVFTVVQMRCWPLRTVRVSITWSTQHTGLSPSQLENSSLRSMSNINQTSLNLSQIGENSGKLMRRQFGEGGEWKGDKWEFKEYLTPPWNLVFADFQLINILLCWYVVKADLRWKNLLFHQVLNHFLKIIHLRQKGKMHLILLCACKCICVAFALLSFSVNVNINAK